MVINGEWDMKCAPYNNAGVCGLDRFEKVASMESPDTNYNLVLHQHEMSMQGKRYAADKDKPVVVTKRDPTEEGEHMWGCHTWLADQLAATCENGGDLYKTSQKLFQQWDAHLTRFATSGGVMTTQKVRTEGLSWLLQNAGHLYEETKREFNTITQEPYMPTPDEDRDWFCWLYRYFANIKKENDRN
jgi:hypothetical protein